MRRWLAAASVLLLYALHQDFWFWHQARPLVFGFLPIGLFYHAAFTLACAAVLWLLVTLVWPAHLETTRAARGEGPTQASVEERGVGAPATNK